MRAYSFKHPLLSVDFVALLVRERSALATIKVTLRVCVLVCQDVRMSVRVFKMLLVRQFLSD